MNLLRPILKNAGEISILYHCTLTESVEKSLLFSFFLMRFFLLESLQIILTIDGGKCIVPAVKDFPILTIFSAPFE